MSIQLKSKFAPHISVAMAASRTVLGKALASADRRKSRVKTGVYPVVFMHGFAGFNKFEVGHWALFEYFNGVESFLNRLGYKVYMPAIRPFAPPATRVNDWLHAIEAIRRETGAEKVHLIGHSQGGIDARLLVAPAAEAIDTSLGPIQGRGYGEHVASVTTVASPHEGSIVADLLVEEAQKVPELSFAFSTLINTLALVWSSRPEDVATGVRALSRAYMQDEFNTIVKEAPGIDYYTVAGSCAFAREVNFLLRPFYEYVRHMGAADGGGLNDGLVTVDSAQFQSRMHGGDGDGLWRSLGDNICADHFAQIGIPLTMSNSERYDHLAMFSGLTQQLDPDYIAELSLLADGQWSRQTPTRELAAVRAA